VESKLGPLGTSATYWPIVPAPGDFEDGEFGGINGRANRSTRRKPAPAPLCPPQIPLDQTLDWTRAAALGTRRLTASAMARPLATLKASTACTGITLPYLLLRGKCNTSSATFFTFSCGTLLSLKRTHTSDQLVFKERLPLFYPILRFVFVSTQQLSESQSHFNIYNNFVGFNNMAMSYMFRLIKPSWGSTH
jgi:hypothetical protein